MKLQLKLHKSLREHYQTLKFPVIPLPEFVLVLVTANCLKYGESLLNG